MLNVEEDRLNNRQKFLNVMYFPTLFPNGKYHPCEHQVKSCLYNKDSRFRKEPRYIFYLLWQKEMRGLSAGVYKVMKSSKTKPMSVGNLVMSIEKLICVLCFSQFVALSSTGS